MKEIILFGGKSDGQKVVVQNETMEIKCSGELYCIIPTYFVAVTTDILEHRSPGMYVIERALDAYSDIRTSGEMLSAKRALKNRIRLMKPGFSFLVPGLLFLFMCSFFPDKHISLQAVGVVGCLLNFTGFRYGFVMIKKMVEELK